MKYYKNSELLEVGDKLQGYLIQFTAIEDFRVEEPEINEMLKVAFTSKQLTNKQRPRSLSENETTAQNAEVAVPTASSVRDV